MGCSGCPSHQGGVQGPEVFVDIVIRDGNGNSSKKFEGISMNNLNAPGRTLQFEDRNGYLNIILLGANDRVEIISQEPLPETEE